MKNPEEEQEEEEEDNNYSLYNMYKQEINTHGIDITPLKNKIFPNQHIVGVGHHGLVLYYKHRYARDRMEWAAVRHAREATSDWLHNG
jgi:hypothetical protein